MSLFEQGLFALALVHLFLLMNKDDYVNSSSQLYLCAASQFTVALRPP